MKKEIANIHIEKQKKYYIVSYHMYGDNENGYYTGLGWSHKEEEAALYFSQGVCDGISGGLKMNLGCPAYCVCIVV